MIERAQVPNISNFNGIAIHMYPSQREHRPPHVHASYGGRFAPFAIETGELMSGYFPSRQAKLVKVFIKAHKRELLKMWQDNNFIKIKGE